MVILISLFQPSIERRILQSTLIVRKIALFLQSMSEWRFMSWRRRLFDMPLSAGMGWLAMWKRHGRDDIRYRHAASNALSLTNLSLYCRGGHDLRFESMSEWRFMSWRRRLFDMPLSAGMGWLAVRNKCGRGEIRFDVAEFLDEGN